MTSRATTDTARMKAIMTLAAALAFAASPFLTPGFGGFEPDRFPVPQADPPAQPAAWAFSIWGLIYLWLLVHAGFGLLRRAEHPGWDAARWPLIASLAVGAAWLPVAKASPLAALVLIWVMLAAALMALFRAGPSDPWLLRGPISVYAGWLLAASWVSVAINGAGYGVLFGALPWAWIAVAGLTAMGAAIQARIRAPGFGLTLAWALTALGAQNIALGNTVLSLAALALAAAFAALGLRGLRAGPR